MFYFHHLWYVIFALPSGASTLPYHHLLGVMTEMTEASQMEEPIDFPDTDDVFEERLRTAAIGMTFGWCEGGWKTDPGGDACGMGQMYPVKGEPTCQTMRTDRRAAVRSMMRRMRMDIAFCDGDVRAGLGRYATGKCGWAQDLVENRCRWSLGACGPSNR